MEDILIPYIGTFDMYLGDLGLTRGVDSDQSIRLQLSRIKPRRNFRTPSTSPAFSPTVTAVIMSLLGKKFPAPFGM
jgi:hypothetical protein